MGRPKNSKNKVKTKASTWSSKKSEKQQVKAKTNDKTNENFIADITEQYTTFPDAFRPNNNGNGSVVKKRKVAPRSGLQFKVGPSFENTTLYRPIFITSTNENVFPFVNARIDRGFENHGGEWIGYKRNYFTLVSCFEFEGVNPEAFFNEKFHILNDLGELENISCFALRLVSRCSEDESVVNLIQHTAKRDRGPQYLPPVFPAISGYLPSHSIIKQASNIRNGDKIDQYNRMFYLDNATLQKCMDTSILSTYPEGRIATVARYERIQFSTSINYRKSTMVNRHFILKVELLGLLDDGKYAVLASTETQPLVVRGRSPSNYQMARRNLKALNFNNQKELACGSISSSSSNTDELPLDDKSQNKLHKKIPLIKSRYNLLEFQKPSKRGRKRKEKVRADNGEKIRALRTYQNQGLKQEFYGLEDEFIDGDLFPPIIQAKQETFDSIFDLFPYQSEFDLNLESAMTPKRPKKSKSKKSKNYKKENEVHRSGMPMSACRSQGTDNSSFNQVEDDSFIEFQKELSILQKELKGDYTNDNTLLGIVT